MKRFLLAAIAACAFSASASAQAANNCAMVQKVMTDLQKDGLKDYRGKMISKGKYTSKVVPAGFKSAQVEDNEYGIHLAVQLAPISNRDAAIKAFKDLVQQMKDCLSSQGFQTDGDSAAEGEVIKNVGATVFKKDGDDKGVVVMIEKQANNTYSVEMGIMKSKTGAQ